MTKIDYPVGDFLIRVKNASLSGRRSLEVRKTKFVHEVAKALKKEGFLESIEERNGNLFLTIAFRRKRPVLNDLKVVSRPGLRVYKEVAELGKLRGPEIYLISTNQGVLSTKEAIKKRAGGEVIAKVT